MDNYLIDTLDGLRETIDHLRHADTSEEHEKLALKCVQKAQVFKDLDLEFNARYAYIRIVTFLQKTNLAIAMFPWLLKKCDEDRQRYDYFMTLWVYKWIVNNARDFSKVPLDKLEVMRLDFEKRYQDFGTGDKVVYYMQTQYWDALGELSQAAQAYQRYLKASTAHLLDDCSACQPNNLIDHLVSHGKYADALHLAEPIVQGKATCHVVPERTYPKLIFPALLLGKIEEAEHYAILARKKLRLAQANLREASHLIGYFALKEDFIKGRNVLEKQFPHSLANVSDVDRFYFLLSGQILFRRMLEKNKQSIRLTLPTTGPLYMESNTYSVEQLHSYFEKQLQLVSTELDQRNGNTYYSDLICSKIDEMKKLEITMKSQQKV